ncbi:MAG: dGTP triphosphohydrolase [Kiloniellaceae bacterium]
MANKNSKKPPSGLSKRVPKKAPQAFEWKKLLSKFRLSGDSDNPSSEDHRTAWERDYDRLVFSAPVRRLADKTQVFPLEKNDSVRTRLTHSTEVSTLARSVGIRLVRKHRSVLGIQQEELVTAIPNVLASVGLAHDLGNPPFGHQGEAAIREWFERNDKLFSHLARHKNSPKLSEPVTRFRNDFLKFEGNAQTLRLLTRLQVSREHSGLNLTCGTLAALMKYTVDSENIDKKKASCKKFGYFATESAVTNNIWEQTGLRAGARHPLTWLMEACDDIAYSVLDIEDSVKKRIVSFHDILAALRREESDPTVASARAKLEQDAQSLEGLKLTPTEENSILTELFRVRCISPLVDATVKEFIDNYDAIIAGTHSIGLLDSGNGKVLCNTLKIFARTHAFNHPSVLKIELEGYNVIQDLMDWFWIGISERVEYQNPASARSSPFASYAYGIMSENYRRIFENDLPSYLGGKEVPLRYREMRLLADMISGMTDGFAVEMHSHLGRLYVR